MDIEQIKRLVQLFEGSGLTALEVGEGETKIRMERQTPCRPASPSSPEIAGSAKREEAADCGGPSGYLEVKAPMVGVFHAAPSPDAEPYVRRGDRVKQGDVLCVVEAMKLLNEIVAEADGEIADICAKDGQVVEFSQTLFKLLR